MSTPIPPLPLTLLQARDVSMRFFRPSLNLHALTDQQWRVIRTLREQGEIECYQLANQACILRLSMTGVLARLERDGIVRRWKAPKDQRRVYVNLTEKGQQCFVSMSGDIERNYQRIQERLGEEKLAPLLELLNELKKI
ncbi:homoprotocatechuate degradation operon regulator HpaR, partial [Pseudomonas aeruginosa]